MTTINLNGLDVGTNDQTVDLAIFLDGTTYPLGKVRYCSRLPKTETRYGCMVPIEHVPQQLQHLLTVAEVQRKPVKLLIGNEIIEGYLDGLPMPFMPACTTELSAFGLFVQTAGVLTRVNSLT